jgi:transcriptional regulator with XRE-family HTH domain
VLDDIEDHVGRRLREIRSYRGLTQEELAGLSGVSNGQISRIESGERTITKRSTLEALANALKVSPTELSGRPYHPPAENPVDVHKVAIAAALDAYELGDDSEVQAREWLPVSADVVRLVDLMQIEADYATAGELIPRLLGELHALYVRCPQERPGVLEGLVRVYSSAVWVARLLGDDGLTLMAAKVAQRCADELERPEWRGYTTWLRGVTTGSLNRDRQYGRAVVMADTLVPYLDSPDVVQAYGQLHLSAALAAAAERDRDTAMTHLDEAGAIADRLDGEVGTFAKIWFGRTNVGIWRVTVGVELGEGARVVEVARNVNIDAIPSPARQSVFYANLGRALLADQRTRDKGLGILLRAESLAPQHIRGDLFVREAVASELRRARRNAGGRDLRGLAYRMGIAPNE